MIFRQLKTQVKNNLITLLWNTIEIYFKKNIIIWADQSQTVNIRSGFDFFG